MIGSWDLYLKTLCNYSKVGSNLNSSQLIFTSEAMLVEGAIHFFSFLIKPACAAGKMHASKETPYSSTVTIEIAQSIQLQTVFSEEL